MTTTRIAYAGDGGEAHDVPAAGPRRFSLRLAIAGGVLALAIAAGSFAWVNRSGTATADVFKHSRPVSATAMEQQYGVKIQMVGILAAGGLLELRCQVIDGDKAASLFGESVDEMPMLAVEGTGKVLATAKGMKHKMTLLDGGSYFLFYTNAGNAVHEGVKLSMVINGVRVEHIVAQR